MAISALLIALMFGQSAPSDPIAASFKDWRVEIEDDLGGADSRVRSVATKGCATTIVGKEGRWTIDWRAVRVIAMEDNFVFLEGPALKMAVVADVRDEAGQLRLRTMRDAMQAAADRCRSLN